MLANLAVGLWAGREVKDMKDYALGTQNYGSGALVMTYIATTLTGGALFRGSDNIFTFGICIFAGTFGLLIGLPFRYYYLSDKFNKFRKCITIGDVLGNLYGDKAKIFSGIVCGIFSLMWVGMEINVLSIVFEKMIGVHANTSLIVSALIVSGYTAIGGMRSVMATDILQFCFLLLATFFISSFATSKIGKINQIIESIPPENLNFFRIDFLPYTLNMFILDAIFSTGTLPPPQFQRFLLAKGPFQVKTLFQMSGLAWILYCSICGLVAFSVKISYPEYDGSGVFLYFFNHIVPNIFKPIVTIGLIGFILSSGDSYLHSAGLSFYNDFFRPLTKKKLNDLFNIRILTFILGIVGTVFAIKGIAFVRVDYTYGLVAATIYFPLTMGLLGFKPSVRAFWYSAIAGIVAFLMCKLNLFGDIFVSYSPLIGAFTNAIVFIVTHFIVNGGKFVMMQSDNVQSGDKESETATQRNLRKIANYLSVFIHFTSWAKARLDRYGKFHYVLFGVFYSAMIVLPYLLWGSITESYKNEIIGLKSIALLMCSLLICNSIWPENLRKKYLPAFWCITITYCLPFISTMMILLSDGAIEYAVNAAITIMLLILLVDWQIAIGITVVGVSSAYIIFENFILLPDTQFSFSFDTKYLLVYQIIFGSVVGGLFAVRKQRLISAITFKNKLLRAINDRSEKDIEKLKDAKNTVLADIGEGEFPLMQKLNDIIKFSDPNNAKVKENVEFLRNYFKYVIEKASDYLKLKVSSISMEKLENTIKMICQGESFDNSSITMISKSKDLRCDEISLLRILGHLFMDLQAKMIESGNMNENVAYFYISDAKIKYTVRGLESYNRQVQAIKIIATTADQIDREIVHQTHSRELVNPEKILPVDLEELGPASINRTIDAHYGIYKDQSTKEQIIVSCILPQNVYDIRPEPLDLTNPDEILYQWPAAEKLEKDFRMEIENLSSKIDVKKIEYAIHIVKKYHSHQMRKSGEPYYMHPIAVAKIALDLANEKVSSIYNILQENLENVILTALLHDTLEETSFHPIHLQGIFGNDVTNLVLEVTKIDYEERNRMLTNKEAFSKLLTQNPVSLCIKLADRMHNLMTIDGYPNLEKRKTVAQETLDFFLIPAEKYNLKNFEVKLRGMAGYIIINGKLEGYSEK